jgi:hypothetical protein
MVENWVGVVIVVGCRTPFWTLCGQGSIPPGEDCFIVITTTSLDELSPKLQNTILDNCQMYDSYENKVAKHASLKKKRFCK